MTRPTRPSIKDVAAEAGVSATTVSDALSGNGRLPAPTRERVKEVADRLGYRPSALARGLRTQQVGLLGFVLVPAASASISTVSYWVELMTKAAEVALDRKFALVMLPPNPEGLARLNFPVDGVIVVDPLPDDMVLAALRQQRIPVVTIGRDLAGSPEPWVADDRTQGALALLDAVAAPGDRVALITLQSRKSYLEDTLMGLCSWTGHPDGYPLIRTVEFIEPATIGPVIKDLMVHEPPDLILGANARVTLAIQHVLAASGFDTPTHVRLASMAEAPELQLVSTPITAVVENPRTSAELAVLALIDAMAGVPPAASTLIPMELAIRASAPARA